MPFVLFAFCCFDPVAKLEAEANIVFLLQATVTDKITEHTNDYLSVILIDLAPLNIIREITEPTTF